MVLIFLQLSQNLSFGVKLSGHLKLKNFEHEMSNEKQVLADS